MCVYGTSDEARDLWFIGYIPQVVSGVWLGNDNNDPTWGSSSTAASTWHQFMAQAVQKMPVVAFPPRPELEGRIGSIKAQKLKPKRIILGRIRPKRLTGQGEQNSLQAIPESNRQRRRGGSRRYDEQNPETTVRRNRRYRSDRPSNNSSPRRLRRSPESVTPSKTQVSPQNERSQPKVRSRSIPQNAPQNTPTKSWRERLKPVERPPNNPPPAAPQTHPAPGFGSDG